MTIRDKYVDIVEGIAQRARVRSLARKYRISSDATRRECIQYALRYVVRHTKRHYRYDRYRSALSLALQMSASQIENGELQLHIDIGCGPGLFTWVVQDRLRLDQISVGLYGYDHSREMVRLAEEIWDELGETVSSYWHSDADEMLATALSEGTRHDHSLVTFGHVLAQTHDNEDAIQHFARIVADVATVNCLIIAVDAHRAGPSFRKGCENLCQALLALGTIVDVIGSFGSCFFANVAR